MSALSLKVATWDLEWATPGSPRGRTIDAMLRELDADILCLTEAHRANFPSGYHVIGARADYGYVAPHGRRKVLLGSKTPWSASDSIGCAELPPGRYASGIVETAVGKLRVIGICVPWRDAHVRTGRKSESVWSEHRAYLRGLKSTLAQADEIPAIVLGDFNQTLPRSRQPEDVARALAEAISGLQVAVRDLEHEGRQAIDHVATSTHLRVGEMTVIPSRLGERRLSDHFGVCCTIRNGIPREINPV